MRADTPTWQRSVNQFAERCQSMKPETCLLRDLQELYLLASLVVITWTVVKQAAQGLRDAECESQTKTQLAWLAARMKQAAPQALIVAE
jgi:hypothetical protein